ncbi:hypothetical protein FOXYSP1_20406 [Fusarium oxysporum f. sp. phaseoli]
MVGRSALLIPSNGLLWLQPVKVCIKTENINRLRLFSLSLDLTLSLPLSTLYRWPHIVCCLILQHCRRYFPQPHSGLRFD